MAILEMKDVSFSESGVSVVKNVNISIEECTMTALMGEAGSGKSTVLKLMAGLIVPTEGNVYFNGNDIHQMNRMENLAFRKRCGFMFQDSALWANQDIYHNLELPLLTHFPKMSKKERKERVEKALQLVNYNKSTTVRPAALSAGEQKIISFARGIICEPDIIFLDEPTASIPPESMENFMTIIQNFISQKKTIVLVSHDNYFVTSFFCDKIYIDKGEVSRTEKIGDMLIL